MVELPDDTIAGYAPIRPKVKAYEVESGTSTADGGGTGTVTFSAAVWGICVINRTDTDDIEFQVDTGDWVPIDQGVKWLSMPVPADSTQVKVKHSADAQLFKVIGLR